MTIYYTSNTSQAQTFPSEKERTARAEKQQNLGKSTSNSLSSISVIPLTEFTQEISIFPLCDEVKNYTRSESKMSQHKKYQSILDISKTEQKILINLHGRIKKSENDYIELTAKYIANGIQMDEIGKDIGNKYRYGCSTKTFETFIKKYDGILINVERTRKESGRFGRNRIYLTKNGYEEANILLDFDFKKDLFLKFNDVQNAQERKEKVTLGRIRHKKRTKDLRKMVLKFSENTELIFKKNKKLFSENRTWFLRNFPLCDDVKNYGRSDSKITDGNSQKLRSLLKKDRIKKDRIKKEPPPTPPQNLETQRPQRIAKARVDGFSFKKYEENAKPRNENSGRSKSREDQLFFMKKSLEKIGYNDPELIDKLVEEYDKTPIVKYPASWSKTVYETAGREKNMKYIARTRKTCCEIRGGTWYAGSRFLAVFCGSDERKFYYGSSNEKTEYFWKSHGMGGDKILDNSKTFISEYRKYCKNALKPYIRPLNEKPM